MRSLDRLDLMSNDAVIGASKAIFTGAAGYAGSQLFNASPLYTLIFCIGLSVFAGGVDIAINRARSMTIGDIFIRFGFSSLFATMVFLLGTGLEIKNELVVFVSTCVGFIGYPVGDFVKKIFKRETNKYIDEV